MLDRMAGQLSIRGFLVVFLMRIPSPAAEVDPKERPADAGVYAICEADSNEHVTIWPLMQCLVRHMGRSWY